MKTTKRVLAVHGYWWGPDSRWAARYNELVCAFVFDIHTRYDFILLLSGWGGNGRLDTIAEFQRDLLILSGGLTERLKTQTDFEIHSHPPLDTWEEVALLKKMLSALGFSDDVTVDVITMHWHTTRTSIIYRQMGLKSGKFFRVDGSQTVVRFVHEVVGLLIALIDRDGQGFILREERLRRLKETRQKRD